MTPDTVHLIALQIRHLRGLLAAKEKWAQKLPSGAARSEEFEVVAFWRDSLNTVERRLARQGSTD